MALGCALCSARAAVSAAADDDDVPFERDAEDGRAAAEAELDGGGFFLTGVVAFFLCDVGGVLTAPSRSD